MFLEASIEYRLCLCVRMGGISSGRVYVHVVKFIGGLSPCCKIHGGGIMSTYTNLSRGGGGGGGVVVRGILSYTEPLRSQTF